jgi:transcriptional regulator
MSEPKSQLLRGTVHVLILKTLAGGPLHGFAIASRIEQQTDGVLAIEEGALYQALHRMQERGWVDSEWGHSELGKRARFYQLTAAGKKRLRLETASWIRYAEAVFKVLQPAGA